MASGRGRTKETGRITEENVGRGMDVGIRGWCCCGFAKLQKFQQKQDNYGSEWVGPGLTRRKNCGNLSQNSPILAPIFWGGVLGPKCTMCILSKILKFVNYYCLSVLSMSVMGFQKKIG